MRDTDRHGRTRTGSEGLIPKHGGYRQLKTFQLSTLIYDVTVRFCEKFIDPRSRTHDQMVQAARSGRQNIAEGSVDSATSRKIELKLTGVAKGSLAELRLDFEDFLRQRGLPEWPPDHAVLVRFKARRCATLEEFRVWVAAEVGRAAKDARDRPCESVPATEAVLHKDLPAVLAANGALSLLNLCIYLLDRQLKAQADAFEADGGFTERLYRRRSARRAGKRNKET
jgi:four helix bundle suffix protein